MLKIRLSRTGKKHAASFRIVVGPENRELEVLGSYNPQLKPAHFEVDKKRIEYWISKGAKLTEAVEALLKGKYEFKPYLRSEKETVAEESASKEVKEEQETPESKKEETEKDEKTS